VTYQQPPFDPNQVPPSWQPSAGPPYGAPRVAPGYPSPGVPPKSNTTKVVLFTVGGVLALCCGVAGVAALSDRDLKSHPSHTADAGVAIRTEATKTGSPAPLSPPKDLKPKSVAMPDVRGQNAAVAQDYLRRLGFTNVTFGSQDEFDTWVVLPANWTVKKQSMKAGRKVPADTLIVLTCTKQQ
jgi:hypothetical protein